MNIDFLMTKKGEPGLICDAPFEETPLAVIFDESSRQLSVEMEENLALVLNIPLEEQYLEDLSYADRIHIGILFEDEIAHSLQAPLIVVEDDVDAITSGFPPVSKSVLQFESFVRQCVSGQPIHRTDLGNEAALKTVMSGEQMIAPHYAPGLVRARKLEAAPRTPAPHNAPQFGGPGGGGGGGGGPAVQPQRYSTRKKSGDEDR